MAKVEVFGKNERIELLHGELVTMTPVSPEHAVRTLCRVLQRSLGERAFIDSQNPLLMPDDSEFYPDVAVLRLREDGYRALPTAGDALLVIEVAKSSLEYDRTVKLPVYVKGRDPEYWVIDLENMCVWVYANPEGTAHRDVRRVQQHDYLQTLDATIPVETLF